VKGLKAFCSISDYLGDARFLSKEFGPTALRQLLIFIHLWILSTRVRWRTAARGYFQKYSNIVRKNLSTAQFGFLQFFYGTRHYPAKAQICYGEED
jgi:hypothetical protein